MVDIPHRSLTGLNAAHPPFYPSESDPTTTLGAYRGWIKPSTGEAWIRNAANTAWLDVVVTGTSTALTAHLSDTSDAHDASAISILDTGADFTATDVEGALAELAAGGGVIEIDDLADVDTSSAPPADGQTLIWDATNSEWIPGSVAAGTVAAADVTYAGGTGMSATDAEAALDELATEKANASDLTDHINDATAAHAASAISYAGGTGMSATNAEAAIDELATEKANDAALTAHIGDTSDAHDASAISYVGGTGMSATDVEAAIDELATEKTDDSALTAHLADATDAHDASAVSFVPAGSIAATNVQAAIEEAASEAGGGGSAHVIQDEGTPLTQRANLSFEGAGVTVTDDAGDAQTVVTIPGGGSGAGNIAGAYDIEDTTNYTAGTLADEFDTNTLDAQWTVVASTTTPVASAVDPWTAVVAHRYDLTTRSKGMLVQPAIGASDTFMLRQAGALANNESLVFSMGIPTVGNTTTDSGQIALALSTTTTFDASTFMALWMRFDNSAFKVGHYINPAGTITERNSGSYLLAARRVYLRITRRNTNDYWFLWSLDGTNWGYIMKTTSAAAFAYVWLYCRMSSSTGITLQPVYNFNWLRHVASANYDLW